MTSSKEDPQVPARGEATLSAGDVAELVGGRLDGDPDVLVQGIAPLDQAREEELGFLAQRRYVRYLPSTEAKVVLVSEAHAEAAKEIPARIVVQDAYQALPLIIPAFYPAPIPNTGIHSTAIFGKGVVLGEGVTVGPYAVLEGNVEVGDGVTIGAHCVIGAGCVVGPDSILHPHVVLYANTRLGARVIIHSGARLGVDGFGYVPTPEGHIKVPQVGACEIGDDVEIGANTTLDRGSIGRTVIGRGTKLDNLIHLAHNVQVGEDVIMAAMVGIAGSAKVGDGAMLGGQAGSIGHLEIGANARIAAQAGIIGDVPPGATVMGFPARDSREYLRAMGLAFKLPGTMKRLEALETLLQGQGDEAK